MERSTKYGVAQTVVVVFLSLLSACTRIPTIGCPYMYLVRRHVRLYICFVCLSEAGAVRHLLHMHCFLPVYFQCFPCILYQKTFLVEESSRWLSLTAFTTITRPFFVCSHMPDRIANDTPEQQPQYATRRRRARLLNVSTPTKFSGRNGSRHAPRWFTRGYEMVYNLDNKQKRQATGPYMQVKSKGCVWLALPCLPDQLSKLQGTG
jgi:hypothetical protein